MAKPSRWNGKKRYPIVKEAWARGTDRQAAASFRGIDLSHGCKTVQEIGRAIGKERWARKTS